MRIGELATRTGITTKTLRFYEQKGLLPLPERAANGYRDYGPAVLLDWISYVAARPPVYPCADPEVIEVRESGDTPCDHVYHLLTERMADVDRQIADLQALRATLLRTRDRAASADPSTCEPDTVCRYV